MDLPRSCLAWSVAMLLVSGSYSAACGRDTGSPPQRAPEPPAARPEPQTTPPSEQKPTTSPQPPPSAPQPMPQKPTTQKPSGRGNGPRTFAIYTLSRGSGVPAGAREAQQKIQKLVEEDKGRGVSVTVETTRIGLEGEQRLCVTYPNARDGDRAIERARVIVKGVDLVNLVVEPCTPPASKPPKKETTP